MLCRSVIPVQIAYDDFSKCLCSLFNYQENITHASVNDCSADSRIVVLLRA